MSERILFVDDEPNVLEGIQRTLRKHADIHTASSGADGLRLMREAGPFALVISDMRMPIMNGVQFLSKARELAPDTVRMILTGQADLEATIASVNEGQIFRFLSKPCSPAQLLAAAEDGLKQYRLVTAEKVLLEQTLIGSVKMLVDVLGLVNPMASARASRLQRYAEEFTKALGLADRWQWRLAALVSQVGFVALPKEILSKVESGHPLTGDEKRLFESHPEIAAKLLAAIPRLEDVSAIVKAQSGEFRFAGKPDDVQQWGLRGIGQLLLRTAIELDRLIIGGSKREEAVEALCGPQFGLPAAVAKALATLSNSAKSSSVRQVSVHQLSPGMVLDEDVMSPKGLRLVSAGQEINETLIVRLTSIAKGVGVVEPFRVRIST